MILTAGEKLRIQRQRAEGKSWPEIGEAHGVHWSILRMLVDVEFKERRQRIGAQAKAKAAERRRDEAAYIMPSPDNKVPLPYIPDSVLTDRAARLAQWPRDTTAAICGDPPRGKSALDQKRGWYE